MRSATKQASTRVATTEGIMELMDRDPTVALVSSDSLLVIKGNAIREKYPDRVVEVGIAEQSGVDISAGLASAGMTPFFATYAGFITMRACEQVRTFVCYSNLNVKLVGANGGVGGGEREGPTHQFIEDLAILRAMPGMTVVVPADAAQVKQAIAAVAGIPGPAFVRIGSGRDPVVYEEPRVFELNTAPVVADYGQDVGIFANGSVMFRALQAAEALKEQGVGATVVDVHTLKPLDVATITRVVKATGAAVTVEDHNIIGGLGSAVAETLSESFPAPLERIGLRDTFGRSGKSEELLDYYHIGVKDIVGAALRVINQKRG